MFSFFHLSPALVDLNCCNLTLSRLVSSASAAQCKYYCSVRCVAATLDRIFRVAWIQVANKIASNVLAKLESGNCRLFTLYRRPFSRLFMRCTRLCHLSRSFVSIVEQQIRAERTTHAPSFGIQWMFALTGFVCVACRMSRSEHLNFISSFYGT